MLMCIIKLCAVDLSKQRRKGMKKILLCFLIGMSSISNSMMVGNGLSGFRPIQGNCEITDDYPDDLIFKDCF